MKGNHTEQDGLRQVDVGKEEGAKNGGVRPARAGSRAVQPQTGTRWKLKGRWPVPGGASGGGPLKASEVSSSQAGKALGPKQPPASAASGATVEGFPAGRLIEERSDVERWLHPQQINE